MDRKIKYKALCYLISFAIFGLILNGEGHAVPAAPGEYSITQADGSSFMARQWGDEWLHGRETPNGFSIVYDESTGNWNFAVADESGELRPSSSVVGKDSPPGDIQRHLRPSGSILNEVRRMKAIQSQTEPYKVVPPAGAANVPVILIDFSDTNSTYSPPDFDNLLFGSANDSMDDYYREVSYGVFSVSAGPSGVSPSNDPWHEASNSHYYYGYNYLGFDRWPGTLVREAVIAADSAGFDFAPYDQDGDCYVDVVNIVHQGSGEEVGSSPSTDIWSHRWSLSSAFKDNRSNAGAYTTNDTAACGSIIVDDYVIQPETYGGGIQTIGVFAHEYGHALGLPDLYDTDYTSKGIGRWSLMASGAWNGGGRIPAHMDAWSKYFLGWVTPTQVTGNLINESVTQAASTPDVYKFLAGTPLSGEYFLVENRQRSGFDSALPGSGLLIWHIDADTISARVGSNTVNDSECYPGGPPCFSDHYGVALVQADNLWDLERNIAGDIDDPYYSPDNTSFAGATSPRSNLYNGSASNVSITNISTSGVTMTADLSPSGGGGAPGAPSNDECSSPSVVSSLPFTDSIDTTLATTAVDDPLQSCSFSGPAQNSNSVWYRYTPVTDIVVDISTCGSDFDTVLSVYTGSCGALTEISCNDDFCDIQSEITNLSLTGGVTYYIEVTDYNTPDGGNLDISITDVTPSGIVLDGGFEAGTPNPSWNESSINFGTPICDAGLCGGTGGGTGPYGGSWWAWFGGVVGSVETSSVDQDITLPGRSCAELRFYLEIPVADTTGFLNASVDGNTVFNVSEADQATYSSYTQVSVDISAYCNNSLHNLSFDSTTDAGAGALNFFVDDVAIVTSSMTFNDVLPGYWAENYISALACAGVTAGCGGGNYCPEDDVTRAQMAVFIIAAMGETPSGAAYNAYFDDIANDGYAPYINRMFELGITSGCATRAYCPNDSITRAQMAVFIIAAMGETPSGAAYNAYFDDIANDGFAPFINRMFELGITAGCAARTYCPNSSVTRAQMAVFLVVAFLGG